MRISTVLSRGSLVAFALFGTVLAACGSSTVNQTTSSTSSSSTTSSSGAGGASSTCPAVVTLPPGVDPSCADYQVGLMCGGINAQCVCVKDAAGKKVWSCLVNDTVVGTTGTGMGGMGPGAGGAAGTGGSGSFQCNGTSCDPATHYCRTDNNNPNMPVCAALPGSCMDCACLLMSDPLCHACNGDTMKGIDASCGG